MNKLLIGNADKTEQLLQSPDGDFLLIDDGDIANAFAANFPDAQIFNPRRHSFNPLPMGYRQARDFAATLYAASPEGQNTLTVRNGRRALTRLFLSGAERISDFPLPEETNDPIEKEALATIADVLLSPVLKRVLCRKPNFTFTGSIIAKLDRGELGDFDAFLLACILIGQFQGQIVLPDFGFYGRDVHIALIRQNRLIAGVGSLAEVSSLLGQGLLSITDKDAHSCLFDDAEILARYAGLEPNTRGYLDFIASAMQVS